MGRQNDLLFGKNFCEEGGSDMRTFSYLRGMKSAFIFGVLAISSICISASDLAIEEVVVTGAKIAKDQQDLGMAVTTVTAQQIKNTFSSELTTLSDLSPNVTMTKQTGFNAVAGGIRGTGNISILVTDDADVGVVVDEFALSHVQSQFVELFDIEQVEIFRGPQGTLFGKNTPAGAINITTKKPVFNEFFGEVSASFSEYASNKSKGNKVNLAVNMPLIEDTLAARLAVVQDQYDGFYTNSKPSSPVIGNPTGLVVDGGGEHIGGIDVLAAKLKFLYSPSDNYEAHLIIEKVEDRSDAPAAANESGPDEGYLWVTYGVPGIATPGVGFTKDPFITGESNTCNVYVCIEDGHRIDVDGIYLNQTLELGNYTVKSITGYRESEELLNSTYSGEAWTSLYDATRNTRREMFQQEFRLSSNFDGPFNFVSGAVMYTDDFEFIVFANLGLYDPTPGSVFHDQWAQLQQTKQDREASAFYFDGTYDLTERTSISAGYRRSTDEKSFERIDRPSGPLSNFVTDPSEYIDSWTNPVPLENFATQFTDSKEWDTNTWRFVVEHNMRDDLMFYGSFSKGFKAGGYAETCGSSVTCQAYRPQEATTTAIGLKGDFNEGTLRLNAEIFSTDYEDILRSQVVVLVEPSGQAFQETRVFNGGESTARGIEVELTWAPTDNFRVDANLGTLDHEYDNFIYNFSAADMNQFGAGPLPAAGVDLSSLIVPFSPELSLGVGATFMHDLEMGGTLTYSVNMHYQDDYETQPFPMNNQGLDANGALVMKQKLFSQGEARTLMNAYLRYTTSDDKMTFTLFGKNLTDQTHRVSSNAVAQLWNFTQYGPPREIGVTVGYNF